MSGREGMGLLGLGGGGGGGGGNGRRRGGGGGDSGSTFYSSDFMSGPPSARSQLDLLAHVGGSISNGVGVDSWDVRPVAAGTGNDNSLSSSAPSSSPLARSVDVATNGGSNHLGSRGDFGRSSGGGGGSGSRAASGTSLSDAEAAAAEVRAAVRSMGETSTAMDRRHVRHLQAQQRHQQQQQQQQQQQADNLTNSTILGSQRRRELEAEIHSLRGNLQEFRSEAEQQLLLTKQLQEENAQLKETLQQQLTKEVESSTIAEELTKELNDLARQYEKVTDDISLLRKETQEATQERDALMERLNESAGGSAAGARAMAAGGGGAEGGGITGE